MKTKPYIRLTTLLLVLSLLLINLASCGFLFPPEPEEPAEEIPYHENYVFNDKEPTDSYAYEAYPYENADSMPIIMGGQYYHGGFVVSYTQGPYIPGYVTFDVSELEGKKLSFVLGATEKDYNFEETHTITQVLINGEVVIDTVVWPRKAPERYTLDLTGAETLTFRALEDYDGEAYIGVAELTAWDGEPQTTGPAISQDTQKLQLVRDILPFSMTTEGVLKLNTERVLTREERDGTYSGRHTRAFWHFVNEPLSVAGKEQLEAINISSSAALAGESERFVCFNLEEQFSYLGFTVGCADVENSKAGSSWLEVWADDERVHEMLVESDRLPQTVSLEIKSCRTLRIRVIHEEGGAHNVAIYNAFVGKTTDDVGSGGDINNIKDLPDVCKLISNIRPYAVASSADENPVLDGKTQFITFSMAGRKYNEGIMLLSQANWLYGNSGAHACFNLEGEFKYLTFKAGIIDKTPTVRDDALKIYLDGELVRTIELKCLDMPQTYEIELNNCRELKIELVGNEAMVRPAYGIAEMVVYRHEIVENELFPEPEMNFPDEMKLVENIQPYLYNFGPGDMWDEDYRYVYDGSIQHGFLLGEEWHHEGFLLKTSVHADLYGEGAQSAFAMAAICSMWMGGLCLLAGETVYESSFAAFDVHGEFTTVTFTVACQDRQEVGTPSNILKIGSNDKLFAEIEVDRDMEPQTYTVAIENTEQLVFWLNSDPETEDLGGSSRYAIYDVIVSNTPITEGTN